jgi:hypothetical protein
MQTIVAQQVGLRRIQADTNHPLGWLLANKTKSITNNSQDNTQQSLLSLDHQAKPANSIHCRTCGVWLQPGWEGTTLRLHRVQRGKTQRRRANRTKASA